MGRFTKFALIFALVIAVSALAIPNLLSTSYVKQRIASQLSELTGRKVALNGSSSVSVSPYLSVSYNDVTISDERDSPGMPLVSMEGLSAKLGLLAALWGDAKFTELVFIRPKFNLRTAINGESNWRLDNGLLAKHLDGSDPLIAESLALGTVEIRDGILKFDDEQQRITHQLTALNGRLIWPDTHSSINGSMNAVWRGEVVNAKAVVQSPLDLMRRKASSLTFGLTAKPLTVDFEGSFNSNLQSAQGQLSASSDSPNRLSDWLGWPASAADNLGKTTIAGQMTLKKGGVEFQEAQIGLSEHLGKGRLQISTQDKGVVGISGTLAFDTLALPALPYILSENQTDNTPKKKIDFGFLGGVTVDVRLSAQSATSPPLKMTDLAASLLVRDGSASFDIGNAKALGGVLAGSLSLKAENENVSVAVAATMTDIELLQLTQVYQKDGFAFSGTGNVDLKLKSTGANSDALLSRLNGEGSVKSKDGQLLGLDLNSVFSSAKAGEDRPVPSGSDSTEFSDLKLQFFVANGTAFLRGSDLVNDTISVGLSGQADLAKQNLAIRGRIIESESELDPPLELPFFVGGTTASPLFVPLLGALRERLVNAERLKTEPAE